MKKTRISALLTLALFSSVTFAKSSNIDASALYTSEQLSQSFEPCLVQFPAKDTVAVMNAFTSDVQPTQLCSDGFAVLYSKKTKTPLIVVERLNAAILADAKGEERTDIFYPDPRLKKEDRAELTDYKGSGFDRGHQAPAADAPNPHAMPQTFALSNMIPQDQNNNRKVWSKLEGDTRKYISRASGDVFVYTGPLFKATELKTMGDNKVWIPSHIFKLVYDASEKRAWAFILTNTSDAIIEKPMSYDDFVKQTGLGLLGNAPIKK